MRHRSEGSDEKTHLFGNFRQCGGFSFLGNGRGKDTKAAWPGWNRVVGVQELNATKETMKWRLEMKDLNCFLTMNLAGI